MQRLVWNPVPLSGVRTTHHLARWGLPMHERCHFGVFQVLIRTSSLQLWQPKMSPDVAQCPLKNKMIPVENHWPKRAYIVSSPPPPAACSLVSFCQASSLHKSSCLASLLFFECPGPFTSAPALSSACKALSQPSAQLTPSPPRICPKVTFSARLSLASLLKILILHTSYLYLALFFFRAFITL